VVADCARPNEKNVFIPAASEQPLNFKINILLRRNWISLLTNHNTHVITMQEETGHHF
jgi:hypothetical protein